MKIRFLGTSDAQGVPRMLCACSTCTSMSPKNRRTRPSVLLNDQETNLLIDISPDFRTQFLACGDIAIPDTVLITHAHNDHIAGLGDYADLIFWHNKTCRIISPPDIIDMLKVRYPYLAKRRGIHFVPATTWKFGRWEIAFAEMNHGANGYSYAIVFQSDNKKIVYAPDTFNLTADQQEVLSAADLLIQGASYWEEYADHHTRSVYDARECLQLREKLKVKQLILTHMSHDIDYERCRQLLPVQVNLAFDGLVVAVT